MEYSKHSIFFEIDCCSLQYKKNFYITFLFYLNVNYIFRLKFVSYLHQQILYYDLCVSKNNNTVRCCSTIWKVTVLISGKFSVQ